MKCGASKISEGNNGKTLPCNEECARLERNRKLAVALNIDQSSHVDGGDHIPYSTETLNLFAVQVKWAQTQEREFRVFATSPEEKRLRFKPMQSQQRAFVHSLAEDFGFDSESMDPEPHRHVMIWKTPRFVSAPNKTLAEALRIRTGQRSATASANVSDNESSKKVRTNASLEPYNGFVIPNPKFGLMVDDLRTEMSSIVDSNMPLAFDIDFLPGDIVVLKASNQMLSRNELQQTLLNIKGQVISAITLKGYGTPELCTVDTSMNVVRRESDAVGGDGWSKVAAKKAAPKTTLATGGFAASNAFSALGSNKVTFAKKKPEKIKQPKAIVVDDWEAAEVAEEEKEKVASGGSGDEEQVTTANELPATNKANVSSLTTGDMLSLDDHGAEKQTSE